jgi:hypothetical protein
MQHRSFRTISGLREDISPEVGSAKRLVVHTSHQYLTIMIGTGD